MRFGAVIKILGILLMIFSLSMLPPILISLYFHEGTELTFFSAFSVTCFFGFFLWFPFRSYIYELKIRDGFLIVTLFWIVLSAFATIPLFVAFYPKLSFTNAMFESVSGLTTTGATILTNLDTLPRSILYYRQQMHLLGGMGIIVLAVAILPMLGIGGMQLYRAETVGPLKTNKLRPRMTQTAKALWYIYAGLVVLCALAYWIAGMSFLDAIGESFSTVATGGFAMHDSSFAFYHSTVIDMIAVVFMIASATNFALHFMFLRQRSFSIYRDPEFRGYISMLFIVIGIVALSLVFYRVYDYGASIVNAIFTVVSISTTTGFTNSDFSVWPTFIPYLIMMLAIIGGCGGSTSGGIKMMRCLMLKEQGKRELKRLVHPQAVFSIKLGDEALPEQVIQSIWAFVAVFLALSIILLLGLLGTDMDFKTAFGVLVASIANTGATIGGAAYNFSAIPTAAKWMCIFAMIAGRLEVFTLLILFTPGYWQK